MASISVSLAFLSLLRLRYLEELKLDRAPRLNDQLLLTLIRDHPQLQSITATHTSCTSAILINAISYWMHEIEHKQAHSHTAFRYLNLQGTSRITTADIDEEMHSKLAQVHVKVVVDEVTTTSNLSHYSHHGKWFKCALYDIYGFMLMLMMLLLHGSMLL